MSQIRERGVAPPVGFAESRQKYGGPRLSTLVDCFYEHRRSTVVTVLYSASC